MLLIVKNLPINATKPMSISDASMSEVFDTSVMKGEVARATGHGLELAFAVVVMHGSL